MTQEDKENFIKIAAEWINLNLMDLPIEEREFWVKDFINFMDVSV